MSYITIRGVDHYYQWIKQDSSALNENESTRSKGVMVFIHGWGGSSRYWEPVAQAMSAEFDCLLYDLRGFGRSQASPTSEDQIKSVYDLETYALDLATLLEALGLDQVTLHSHSTGSSIAAIFLNRYPDLVQTAILTCNGIFEFEAKAFEQFHRLGGYVVKFRPRWMCSIPGLADLFMARFLTRSIAREYKTQFLADFVDADYQAALGTMLTAVSKDAADSMPTEFSRLPCPTLLVSGARDKIIPAEMGAKAAALNPHITHHVIERTGHFPMLEAPQQYLTRVSDFMAAAC
ncbi:MAG: alpha/beta hydrolase [Cyanobacteria bacterium P01_F01_bin.42]